MIKSRRRVAGSVARKAAGPGAGALLAAAVTVLGQGQPAGAAQVSRAAPVSPAITAAAAAAVSSALPAARAAAGSFVPPKHVLKVGDHGPAVRKVQQRLSQLHYYAGKADGSFGANTQAAVWAFERVQGLRITAANADEITRAAERDLAHPRAPKVLAPHGRPWRVEVNKQTQVLVLYRHGKIELISHVSTGAGCLPGQGCGWVTPTGNYRAEDYMPGWVHVPLGEMFNPVFFISTVFAIHGDTFVPWYPDSHGCVRVPMFIARFFHNRVHVAASGGTPVIIRNH
ncbi:MAG TPA: L,D-transpeptidase family protein [Streptosporangiaceae bacterium]